MALTTKTRDEMPETEFAVPGKRKLPMHDEKHVRMAWDMVDRTQGLTDEERAEARRRLLRKAKELEIDTADWHKIKAMAIEAMSLEVPEVKDHPNRMPFSGILVRLDEPSTLPPHGSGKRRIIVTRACAEKALPSLLGMGVNFTEKLDGHDPQKKIGIISVAEVREDKSGAFIHTEGFIYASDFPDAAARIRADKKRLGFSFEAVDAKSADPGADPLVITECVFTGAAILRKDKAAFSTTALAANADRQIEDFDMTPEELKAAIAAAVGETLPAALKPITDRLEKIEASATTSTIQAKANTEKMVEPHANALDSAADAMECAGIGGHAERGHVAIARKMAKHLRAAAALGQIPHVWNDHSFLMASGDKDTNVSAEAIKQAVESAMKPLKDEIATQATTIKDLKAAAANAVKEPERRSVPAALTALLAKGDQSPDGDGKYTVEQVDKILDAQQVSGVDRIEAKTRLKAAGMIAA